MHPPLRHRHQIPFFYPKSEKEFQEDSYERFDPMVIRQSALHLMDELWRHYPMQAVLDFSKQIEFPDNISSIAEIGCGVGRWIAELAKRFPSADCWGIDYSYQMLKRAQEVWVAGDEVYINLARYGFSTAHKIRRRSLSNLQFGLAKANDLPFADESQDLVINSFLLDRLNDPIQGLGEMRRILRPGGNLILITPLNFLLPKLWDLYYPPIKLHNLLIKMGFEIMDWQDDMMIDEPLDRRGNVVRWRCVGMHLRKV